MKSFGVCIGLEDNNHGENCQQLSARAASRTPIPRRRHSRESWHRIPLTQISSANSTSRLYGIAITLCACRAPLARLIIDTFAADSSSGAS